MEQDDALRRLCDGAGGERHSRPRAGMAHRPLRPANPDPRGHDDLRRGLHAPEPDRLARHVFPHVLHARARSSLGGYLPISVAIVNWFRRKRALALSISSTGMSVGGLLTPVVVLGLTRLGWRWTAFLSGVVILLVGLPLSGIVRRHRPEAYGLEPDGDTAAPVEVRAAPRAPAPRPSTSPPREAMRAPALWLIAAGHGSALLVVSAVMVHFVTDVTERLGFSLRQAAAIVALMTVVQIAGQLGGGFAGDRFSKRAIVVGCMAAHADRAVPAGLGHDALDGRRLRRAPRPRLGRPGPADGRAPRGLLRQRVVRHDHGHLLHGGHDRDDGRAARGGHPRRSHGQLPDGLPGAGRPARPSAPSSSCSPAAPSRRIAPPPAVPQPAPCRTGEATRMRGSSRPAPSLPRTARLAGDARRSNEPTTDGHHDHAVTPPVASDDLDPRAMGERRPAPNREVTQRRAERLGRARCRPRHRPSRCARSSQIRRRKTSCGYRLMRASPRDPPGPDAPRPASSSPGAAA